MRASVIAVVFVTGTCAELRAELIPHTGNFSFRREVAGNPPEPFPVGLLAGSALVNTLPTPNPESVTYEYPAGLTLAAPPSPVQFFIALNPIAGTGQHVPVAPFDWESTLTFLATATHGSTVYAATMNGSFRTHTPAPAFEQPAVWVLLADVRLFLGGNPNATESLVLEAGSTLGTIPAPGTLAVGAGVLALGCIRRRPR